MLAAKRGLNHSTLAIYACVNSETGFANQVEHKAHLSSVVLKQLEDRRGQARAMQKNQEKRGLRKVHFAYLFDV